LATNGLIGMNLYRLNIPRLRKKPRLVKIYDEIEKHKVILVEGGVGSGKSKLLRHIVFQYTQPDTYLDKKYLPILLTYKEFIDIFKGDIDSVINSNVDQKLRSELEGTQYLLLIDAFDEKDLSSQEQFEKLNLLIVDVKNRKNIRIVLTSRYISVLNQETRIETDISRYDIRPLSLTRTIEFITMLCSNLNISSRLIEDLKNLNSFESFQKVKYLQYYWQN
jgi:chromosomal replication initiation ATPase DnaA